MRCNAAVAFLWITLLVGCADRPGDKEPIAVAIAPGVSMVLPQPGELDRSIEAVQMVTARQGSDTFTLEGRLSARPDMVLVVSSDSIGRRALTIRWTGRAIEVERANWMPVGLKPENVLADLMLMYWPRTSVAKALGGSAQVTDGTGERVISRDGQPLIRIRYEGAALSGRVTLSNVVWSYEIEVRSMILAP